MYVWIVTIDGKFSEVFTDNANPVARISESVRLSWSRSAEKPELISESDDRVEWTMGVEAFRTLVMDHPTHL